MQSLPTPYNLQEAYRDDDYGPIYIRVRGSDGNYIDFSASTHIQLHVKNRKNGAIVLRWALIDGTIDFADNYYIILSRKPGSVMNMPGGRYNYDMQATIGDSNRTYLRGEFVVHEDITRINV